MVMFKFQPENRILGQTWGNLSNLGQSLENKIESLFNRGTYQSVVMVTLHLLHLKVSTEQFKEICKKFNNLPNFAKIQTKSLERKSNKTQKTVMKAQKSTKTY